eukprot:Skav207791  [mRNA]  locus=scaffold710:34022:37634:+ [translate_table: standard]
MEAAGLHRPRKQDQRTAEQTGKDLYQGGLESASLGCDMEKAVLHGGEVEPDFAESTMRTIFGLDQYPVEPAGSFGPAPAPGEVPDSNVSDHGRRKRDLVRSGVEGLSLRSSGPALFQRILEVCTLRSQTTGKRDKTAIYPLPTSRNALVATLSNLNDDELSWLQCVTVSLNSVWGGDLHFDGEVNESQRLCLAGLIKDVKRFCTVDGVIPEVDWSNVFKTRAIDYRGDEVKVARKFRWENISPALPNEVGKVPLSQVCTKGCREYVENFTNFLKPTSEWGKLPRPKVMVADDDWGSVCEGLVQSGVCVYIEEGDVFSTDQGPLLNGMFGVSKEEWTEANVEIYRFIMNLIPLNKLCQPISGDVDTLPAWSTMSPFFIQPNENLLISSEDVKCFFYTMAVPSQWVPFLAFNKAVPEHVVPEHMRGGTVYIASRVLPMGFLNSVSLAQHVHRNLVEWSKQHYDDVNHTEGELRKDRSMSVKEPLWRVYLDNYDLLERVSATQMVDLEGTCPTGVLALRQEYETWGVPRNAKKSVSRSSLCELQGATVDGIQGVAYPRGGKLLKYFGLAFSLLHLKGQGVCVTHTLTQVGAMVADGQLRGECPETSRDLSVFVVSLFDGIGSLRVALDVLGVQVLGYVSVEIHEPARRVVESHYPGVLHVEDVQSVDFEMVQSWARRFGQCDLVLLGAGPPCQGVSGLNSDRKGALRDLRSNLFVHVPRVREMLKKVFKWCPTHDLVESVASMDLQDKNVMSEAIGSYPIQCDSGDLTWAHRPRLYWLSWDILPSEGYHLEDGQLYLVGDQPLSEVISAGWQKVDESNAFPTFTTSRPRGHPGRKPAGVHHCDEDELQRWHDDAYRFPPYQYRRCHGLVNRGGTLRLPDVNEREVILGFPLNYTQNCVTKSEKKHAVYNSLRLSLLGNAWSVPVVACLLNCLFSLLGWTKLLSAQEVLNGCRPGFHPMVQGRLLRLPLNPPRKPSSVDPSLLASKLGNLISIKGEDILLTTPTTQMQKYHRLRASVPARLWRWKVVAGWSWTKGQEHINSLELRAIFTAMRWRLEHQHHFGCRLIHLTDSLVCLHALTRGRSSSRKLRRTLARLNALTLAGNVRPVWGYIHTHQNPADKPSRWGRRIRTKFRNG